ncbi:MAG: hypothetical protein ISR58_02055 [Anaerolineales bacterium]|nr:hypothetical protein [Chloroflexota bacterium]MBL6979950.1 hypothetical protein [Anaerolineales bacterium]
METMQGLLLAIGWFLLRFSLPVLGTALVILFFKRLDARWQAEVKDYKERAGLESLVPVVRCWLLNDCPEEKRQSCPSYQNQEKPCWQHFRAVDGALKESCLGCGVFRGAPAVVPISGD